MTNSFWFLSYNFFFLPLLFLLVKFSTLYIPNLKENLKKRKNLWYRLEKKISKRNWEKPLIWFHVASAGEYLQAQPVIARCIEQGAECILTYSSINAYRWIENKKHSEISDLLATEFLPYDSIRNALRLLGLIQPSRLVWVSYDLWPNLIWEAKNQNIPQSIISAIVHKNSPRTKRMFGRSFYKSLYSCMEHILTASKADRDRIILAIPKHKKVEIMGETRCDSVLERRMSMKIPELPQARTAKFVFVAASTWPKDESNIFPSLKEALKKFPRLFLIIAPHEPTEKHLKNAETFFRDFKTQRFSEMPSNPNQSRILLLDTIGILAEMYHFSNMVYVGGSFTSGVHNILEPASMKATVTFGPKYNNSKEAVEMVKQKIAFSVRNSKEFRKLLFSLIENKKRCLDLGEKSCTFIEKQAGATDICVPLLMQNIN